MTAAELPAFPPAVAGYTPFPTPGFRVRGCACSKNRTGFQTPVDFSSQMNNCSDALWVVRVKWPIHTTIDIMAMNEVPNGMDPSQIEVEIRGCSLRLRLQGYSGWFIGADVGFALSGASRGPVTSPT